MKKLVALILVLITITLTSCEHMPEYITELISSQKVRTVSFTANYDYGFHQKDKVTLLLDGSNVFFDESEYGIGRINAGDIITMQYRGGALLIQESYPSTVVTKDIEILSISVERAKVIKLTVQENEDGLLFVDNSEASYGPILISLPEQILIISEDGSFEPLSEKHVNTDIYATVHTEDQGFKIHAHYNFNPTGSD